MRYVCKGDKIHLQNDAGTILVQVSSSDLWPHLNWFHTSYKSLYVALIELHTIFLQYAICSEQQIAICVSAGQSKQLVLSQISSALRLGTQPSLNHL